MSINKWHQAGITLIEQIVFMIIVSVGVIGLVSVMGPMVQHSADPVRTKQLAAIAESLLSEVLHQPFTWCDPEDAKASTAQAYTGATGCATYPQNTLIRVPLSEDRYGTTPGANLDNVADYGGFVKNDIDDASGANAMAGYNASVAVVRSGAAFGLGDDSAALAVTVTISRDGESFSLTGYRFRYAPRT